MSPRADSSLTLHRVTYGRGGAGGGGSVMSVNSSRIPTNERLPSGGGIPLNMMEIELLCSMVFGICGMAGACVVIMVYNTRHKATQSECMITALSVTDFCYNLFYLIITYFLTYPDQSLMSAETLEMTNFFLFGFTITASFLLISLMTVNRYYAICRATEYRSVFTRRRVRWVLASIFGLSALQGLLNASHPVVSPLLQTVIDAEFYLEMDLLVSVAASLMLFVYYRVMRTLRLQRHRLNRPVPLRHSARSHAGEQSNHEMTDSLKVPAESPGACLLAPSTGSAPPRMDRCSSVLLPSSPLQGGVAAPRSSQVTMTETRSAAERVTFTLFVISVSFMLCVCPFIVTENVSHFAGLNHPGSESTAVRHLRMVARILFLFNFIVSPFIYYSTSSIFRERLAGLVRHSCPPLLSAAPRPPTPRSTQNSRRSGQLSHRDPPSRLPPFPASRTLIPTVN